MKIFAVMKDGSLRSAHTTLQLAKAAVPTEAFTGEPLMTAIFPDRWLDCIGPRYQGGPIASSWTIDGPGAGYERCFITEIELEGEIHGN